MHLDWGAGHFVERSHKETGNNKHMAEFTELKATGQFGAFHSELGFYIMSLASIQSPHSGCCEGGGSPALQTGLYLPVLRTITALAQK